MTGTLSDTLDRGRATDRQPGPYPIGLVGILVTVGMLFAAFTAAIAVRRGATDWVSIALPWIVWINTLILVLSSGTVVGAVRAVRLGRMAAAPWWLAAALALGTTFLVGQVVAWMNLTAQEVVLATGPYAAFFYLLSAVHGAHVVGGLAALAWTRRRAVRGAYGPERHGGLRHAAIYWHFVGGVWVYLLVLLSVL